MSRRSIAIIDSGGANIASLLYAFKRLDTPAALTTDAREIMAADRVILPGVGAARDAMNRLRDSKLIDVIRQLQQPVLGICLGMQLLLDGSEEEDTDCLGVIPGTAQKLRGNASSPVPNMGWCPVTRSAAHELLTDLEDGTYFYFLHSYAAPVSRHTLATAKHDLPFSAVLARDNFVAAQFHPERSAVAGARLLRNFVGLPA